MKKVLLATTALVLSAGVAAAEVELSGDGRMGVVYDGDNADFSSRARVKFTLSGETDTGLSFGGAFRVDQENYSDPGYLRSAARGTAGSVYIKGAFGQLEMGDVVSASEAAVGDLPEIGYTDGAFVGDIEESPFLIQDGVNLNQGPSALYSYSAGAFSIYASLTDGVDNYNGIGDEDDVAYSVAAACATDVWAVGLGYADYDEADEISVSGSFTTGDLTLKALYLDQDYGDDTGLKYYGIGASYTVDATTIKGFVNRYDVDGGDDYDTYGIGVDYDLGGGATLAAGIADSDLLDDTVADFGVKFKF